MDPTPGDVVACMDECGVELSFVFAPLISQGDYQMTNEDFDDIRRHNDYIAHYCSFEPDRLLAFAVLGPAPELAGGDLNASVALMVEETRRCYHELGIRGVKIVPDGWHVNDRRVRPFFETMAELGMYGAFHSGIFLDGKSSEFCRPASYEGLRWVEGFRGHLAHLGWPWVDECIATLLMEDLHPHDGDGYRWQLKGDFSFGCPTDWQLDSLRKALGVLSPERLMFGSDVFWPCDPNRFLEEYLVPQLSNFEAAATLSRAAGHPGTSSREELRHMIFFQNAFDHWSAAIKGNPQRLARQKVTPATPNATPNTC
jgi:hypothetical protein